MTTEKKLTFDQKIVMEISSIKYLILHLPRELPVIILFILSTYIMIGRYQFLTFNFFIIINVLVFIFKLVLWHFKYIKYRNSFIHFLNDEIIWFYNGKKKIFNIRELTDINYPDEDKRGLILLNDYIELVFKKSKLKLTSLTPNFKFIKSTLKNFLKEKRPGFETLII